jgi:hypothetical protein
MLFAIPGFSHLPDSPLHSPSPISIFSAPNPQPRPALITVQMLMMDLLSQTFSLLKGQEGLPSSQPQYHSIGRHCLLMGPALLQHQMVIDL